MFSGIVSNVGSVVDVAERNDVRHVSIACDYMVSTIEIGASISCAGVCLTVVSKGYHDDGRTVFEVDIGPETLWATNASSWDLGTRLNLERSLKVGEELSGHLVAGHVDGLATILNREDMGETTRFTFEASPEFARFIAPKGSVCLDGTSLTVNEVEGSRFTCHLIPHTLQVTTWNGRQAGDTVNLEVDMIARYVARLTEVD
jgi:riboflavin synthase